MQTDAPDWFLESDGPERTEELAASLAHRLRGGEIILLHGPLGAGKTCFAGGLASALGITEPAISPTFVLLRSYGAPPTPERRGLTLHHLDFYRLEGDRDLETLDLEECLGEETVVIVEWPERCPAAFPAFSLELSFVVTGENHRRIEGRWGELAFDREGWRAAPGQP